ncbi:hypothetical protein B0O99DRAFT_743329 [Bisporella sp. PMI_857]|nr:hypothetical protein B0O99DRAFT_743329 [Bisporella sp. PMI_857]
MSAEVATLAFPGNFSTGDASVSENHDVEMISELTADIIKSDSASSNIGNMSSPNNLVQPARDREDRVRANNEARPPSTLGSPPQTTTWRAAATRLGARAAANSNGSVQSKSTTATHVPFSSVKPGPVWPTENQLKVATTYGIRLEDGSYVPLLRADELGKIDFVKVQCTTGPENMIVLPPLQLPRGVAGQPDGKEEMVAAAFINTLPSLQARRPDGAGETEVQMHIDSIVAASPPAPAVPIPRRHKVYCDKWLHEGVCAFTQLGCRFKHEMPLDKATQVALGLNHGLPAWYKRQQQVTLMQPMAGLGATTNLSSMSASRSLGSWRGSRENTTVARPPSFVNAAFHTNPRPYGPSSFGPIGPPTSRIVAKTSSLNVQAGLNNPFGVLGKYEDELSDEEGEITFPNRRL